MGAADDFATFYDNAFARASARWSRLRDYDAPGAWVRRVALNLAANGARRARRRVAALLRLGPPPPVPPVDPDDVGLAEALRTLPISQRQVLVLHYLVGMSVAEVAATLGTPAGTVRVRLHRGRRALAERLGENGDRPGNAAGLPLAPGRGAQAGQQRLRGRLDLPARRQLPGRRPDDRRGAGVAGPAGPLRHRPLSQGRRAP